MTRRGSAEICFEPDQDLRAYADALSFELPLQQVTSIDVLAPTTPIIVMSPDRQGFESVWAHWGMVPRWHDGALKGWNSNRVWTPVDEVTSHEPANAPWVNYHCLVPILSFTLPSSDGKHLLQARPRNGAPMAAAGLWSQNRQGGKPVASFTILTRPAPGSVAAVQSQEPILLCEDNWWAWLVHQSVAALQASPAGETHTVHLSDRRSPFQMARRSA